MVGKIGTVTKRTPAKPAVKRVAKPGAKPAVKRVAKPGVKPAVKRVANAAKPGVKRAAKPVAKRAGVKRATPKAKKVNFDKLLIIIRNVANRTHKKGRMTGGALEDAKNEIFKYLVGSGLTTAIIGLIQNDDSNTVGITSSTPEDNFLFRQPAGIKKVGTGGTMVELLTAVDTVLNNMKNAATPLGGANGNTASIDNLKNIAHIIATENGDNTAKINDINTHVAAAGVVTTPLAAAAATATAGNTHIVNSNTPVVPTTLTSLATYPTLQQNFDVFNASPSLAISSITSDNIDTSYGNLINILDELTPEAPYTFIKDPAISNGVDANVKKNFAMLMIAITLAKIHKIIEAM